MAVPYNRTVLGQVYDANQIYNQYDDVAEGDFGFVPSIEEGSEFDTPYTMNTRPGLLSLYDRFTGPIKRTFQNYGAPIAGGLLSAFTGIPGISFLMRNLPNDPYARNRIDMYGAYRGPDGFIKDKFGYNVGSTLFRNNFMQPGSNSYRSYALEGLRSLNKNAAEKYYQETYGIKPTENMSAFDIVKKNIQQKEDPFDSRSVIDMGADYQGGGAKENQSFNDSGKTKTGFGSSGYGRDPEDRMAKGGIVSL